VDDIGDGLMRAGYFDSTVGQEFNLASGQETRILALANMINELTGNTAGVTFTERRKWDTKDRLLASIERARSLIGYEPRVSMEEGLKETVHWFKEHWEWIKAQARFEPGVSSAVRSYWHDIKAEHTPISPPASK
jgi:nucleoside-diphosphate-sugar epimerase